MKAIISLVLYFSITSVFAAEACKVSFVQPKNNDVVPQDFEVHFGVEGMTVAKAGEMKKGTGHHHLILDGKSIPKGTAVPKDETHKHFGDGATSTKVKLPPGKHTLTLQFADGSHMSYGEECSSTISVTVK